MPHTLLLADDSVTIQRVIELTFADEDIRVVAVSDGEQAIAAIDRNPPDIVLADVGMPGRDGYEVAAHIKNTPRLAHIPVLLLTGAFEPVDQARAADVGCDGVLAKPFEPQLVIGRVKELLAKPKPLPSALDAALAPPQAPARPWTSILDEPAPARGPISPLGEPGDVDQYFDRLDRAFASLSNAEKEDASKPAQRPVPDEVNWFATTAGAPLEDLPLAPPPPPMPLTSGAVPTEAVTPLDPLNVVSPPTPLTSGALAKEVSAVPLADAFAALLAAEQSVAPPPPAAWPPVAPPPPPEATIPDAVIEEVVRRVLDRLSDRVVRETVRDIASETAERLVREEIDAIKKANS